MIALDKRPAARPIEVSMILSFKSGEEIMLLKLFFMRFRGCKLSHIRKNSPFIRESSLACIASSSLMAVFRSAAVVIFCIQAYLNICAIIELFTRVLINGCINNKTTETTA